MTGFGLLCRVALLASAPAIAACATGVTIEGAGSTSEGAAPSSGGSSEGGAGGETLIGGTSSDGGSPPAQGGAGVGGAPNPGCGDGQPDAGEQCDDGNGIDTDACLSTCLAASCGDGFTQAGVEQCDDGNLLPGDGCSATCTLGNVFGPTHTFEGMQSSFYITQFACSQSGGDPAGDALWFCQHFYNNPSCTASSYTATSSAGGALVMMHAGNSCNNPDPAGFPIAGTACNGGPCKIGTYQGPLGGLADIVCSCL